MKKLFFIGFSGMWLLALMCIKVNGQLADNRLQPSARFTVSKKNDPDKSQRFFDMIDPAVIRNFMKTYKDVSDEKWFEVKDRFVAMFNLNDVDYQVAYDKKGNLLCTIRTYDEAKMSRDLRHIVKSTYYDYAINRVQEIEKPLKPVIYIIQLLSKRDIINLSISDGEMDASQKFKRSE